MHFLVRETLAPRIAALSPPDDPWPAKLLRLTIVDPAMGSGHFLVEACRQLADALLAACISCDERGLHDRIAALPDMDNSMAPYLPSRGFNEMRARAICRRLVAVHCLYGCDRNGLAVELAKLSLWLESHAEGLPLTFLDHRLVAGDALTGPFFDSLLTLPVTGGPLDPLLARGVADRLNAALDQSRGLIAALDASIGRDAGDLAAKQVVKQRLDAFLHPLRQLAKAWAGAAMLRERDSDDLFLSLAHHVADTGGWPATLTPRQQGLAVAGRDAVPWDLVFPEIFPDGFSIVLGNPPWDVMLPNTKDFLSAYDLTVLDTGPRTAAGRDGAPPARAARYRQGIRDLSEQGLSIRSMPCAACIAISVRRTQREAWTCTGCLPNEVCIWPPKPERSAGSFRQHSTPTKAAPAFVVPTWTKRRSTGCCPSKIADGSST